MWINHEIGVFKIYFIVYLLLITQNYLSKKLIFAQLFINIDPTARSSNDCLKSKLMIVSKPEVSFLQAQWEVMLYDSLCYWKPAGMGKKGID